MGYNNHKGALIYDIYERIPLTGTAVIANG